MSCLKPSLASRRQVCRLRATFLRPAAQALAHVSSPSNSQDFNEEKDKQIFELRAKLEQMGVGHLDNGGDNRAASQLAASQLALRTSLVNVNNTHSIAVGATIPEDA